MRTTEMILGTALVVGFMVMPALGDDVNPPPWRDNDIPGQRETSYTEWQFGTPADPAPPDEWRNTWDGVVVPTLDVDAPEPWYSSWEERAGVWMLSGQMIIEIDNNPLPPPGDYKDIWIQITWWSGDDATGVKSPLVEVSHAGSEDPERAIIIDWGEEDPNGWRVTTYWIRIQPNPVIETIRVWSDWAYVDQIVVDTICWDVPDDPPPHPDPIPTVSEWGLFVMTLLVLSAGTIVFRRFRAAAA